MPKLWGNKKTQNDISAEPVIIAHRDIWAIDACKRGRTPWDDTCLQCGECGRFDQKKSKKKGR